MTATRPDICYIVTKLSQHMANPNSKHVTLAKHAVGYVKSTINQKLIFRKSEVPSTWLFFVMQIGQTLKERKSETECEFELSAEGVLISWKSKKQPTVAPQVNEDTQMSRRSKNFIFFVLSFQWLLGSSDVSVLVTTNFLSMTTSMKKGTQPAFFLAYI